MILSANRYYQIRILTGIILFGTGLSAWAQDRVSLLPRIDTHIHLYDTEREGSSTFLNPVKHERIYFPHFAQQFMDTASTAGIDYAVVVEASQRREDNFWLMQHVDSSRALLAFIANLDPRDPFFEADLDSLCSYEKFRGIRIRPATPINIAEPGIMDSFAHLADRSLVLELGGKGVDPKTISAIARRYPGLNIIMNHLAGTRMRGGQVLPDDYLARLSEFASEPNVYCKISALYSLIGQSPAPIHPDVYKPIIDPVLDAFGPDRVIFGSNWTLSDMHGRYGDLIAMLDYYLEGREGLSEEMFYYENINKAYGINRVDSVNTKAGNEYNLGEMPSVFPNPACSQLIVSSNERAIKQLRIFDLQGRKAPHLPFSFPERYNEYLDDVDIPEPASIDEDYDVSGRAPIMKTNIIKVRTFQGGIPMFGSWEDYVKAYYRSSQALDDAVGTILEAIDKAGITDETIVIYSSDQGYTLGEHGMTEKHYG